MTPHLASTASPDSGLHGHCVVVLLSPPSWEAQCSQQLQGKGRPAPGAVQAAGEEQRSLHSLPHTPQTREAPGLALPKVGGGHPPGSSHVADQPGLPEPPCCTVHLRNRPSYPPLAGEKKPRTAMGWGYPAGDKRGSGAWRSRWVRSGYFRSEVTGLCLIMPAAELSTG